MFVASPLEQFLVTPYLGLAAPVGDGVVAFAVTNETVALALLAALALGGGGLALRRAAVVPGAWQAVVEELVAFVRNLVVDNIGAAHAAYVPLIFLVFLFILLGNLLGMVPYAFTVTSHIMVTFTLALGLFVGINLIGVRAHGWHFLEFFMPAGAPLASAPVFVAIELLSYVARVFSLSIRLFANLMSGHALMKILAEFAKTMLQAGGVLLVLAAVPLAIIVAVTLLELSIAVLQAYVFSILVCLYLNDALHLAH